ncbi:unnamed protein product [Arabidopsis halleri]
MSSKERDNSQNYTNIEGQSTKHQIENNIILSFEPLMAELDRLQPRPPQVFVNFCNEELGDNFIRHLVWALRDSGINVFTDSYKVKGSGQKKEVFTSIEESNIALAIFSKRYSESNRCLNELVMMEELVKEGKLVVIPVFYNVKTNEVRRLEGEFGNHFTNTKERFVMEPMMVESWEKSLKSSTVTGRIGLSLEAHINEFALVGAIVREVTRLLPNSPRRRKLGIREVFLRALTATFILICSLHIPYAYA